MNTALVVGICLLMMTIAAPVATAGPVEELTANVEERVGTCILIRPQEIPPFSIDPEECLP